MNSKVKSILKWVLAALLLGILFSRMDMDAFQKALANVSPKSFFILMSGFVIVNYFTDALSSFYLSRVFTKETRLKDLLNYRGRTYLLAIAHQNLGVGGIAFFLRKRFGLSLAQAGAFLFMLFSADGVLISISGLVFLPLVETHFDDSIVKVVYLCLFLAYAVLTYTILSPKPLPWKWIQKFRLKDGPVHFSALPKFFLSRILNYSTYVWVVFAGAELFSVSLDVNQVFALLPICLIIGFLPITPFGLGTFPAAMGFFLGQENEAMVAFSLCYLITITILRVPLGLIFWFRKA